MSIGTDLRAYAESARDQGTELVAKLTSTVGGLTAAANGAAADLRNQAGRTLGAVRNDARVSGLVDRAETVTRPVLTLVQERVVEPVLTLAGHGPAAPVVEPPAAPAPRKPATGARKPAATRPAAPRAASPRKATPPA
jgi:hypothetical protein